MMVKVHGCCRLFVPCTSGDLALFGEKTKERNVTLLLLKAYDIIVIEQGMLGLRHAGC